jgi:hypothetical protein
MATDFNACQTSGRCKSAKFALALAIGLSGTASASDEEQRIQLWQYDSEAPLTTNLLGPKVLSTRWDSGDLEVLFTQAAPCGDWLPVNPHWTIVHRSVTLDFYWHKNYPSASRPSELCQKFVRAWVIDVPKAKYTVKFGSHVKSFE